MEIRNNDLSPVKRPKVLDSATHQVLLGCAHTMYVTVSVDTNNDPLEVFATVGKSGTCLMAQVNGLCRCISVGLRSGIPVKHFVHTLRNTLCDQPRMGGPKSCSDAISTILSNYVRKE